MARRRGEPVDTGNAAGGRLPRGPNPRTSLARRLPRSPCAAPPVRPPDRGVFSSPRSATRATRARCRARPQARNALESGNDSDGRQGRTASLDGGAPQPPAPFSGRPRDGGTALRPGRGHRRAEPGPVPRVRRGRHDLRHPRRGDPPGVRPADGLHQGPAHPGPPRAGRRPRGRGLRLRDRQGRRLHGHVAARVPPTWSRRSPTPTWTPCRSWPSPARSRRPRSARMPSRRPTSAASRCRSPSTTTWSPTRRRSRARSPRRSTSPRRAVPARSSSTSARTRCRPRRRSRGRRRSTCPATARSPGRTTSRSARRPG